MKGTNNNNDNKTLQHSASSDNVSNTKEADRRPSLTSLSDAPSLPGQIPKAKKDKHAFTSIDNTAGNSSTNTTSNRTTPTVPTGTKPVRSGSAPNLMQRRLSQGGVGERRDSFDNNSVGDNSASTTVSGVFPKPPTQTRSNTALNPNHPQQRISSSSIGIGELGNNQNLPSSRRPSDVSEVTLDANFDDNLEESTAATTTSDTSPDANLVVPQVDNTGFNGSTTANLFNDFNNTIAPVTTPKKTPGGSQGTAFALTPKTMVSRLTELVGDPVTNTDTTQAEPTSTIAPVVQQANKATPNVSRVLVHHTWDANSRVLTAFTRKNRSTIQLNLTEQQVVDYTERLSLGTSFTKAPLNAAKQQSLEELKAEIFAADLAKSRELVKQREAAAAEKKQLLQQAAAEKAAAEAAKKVVKTKPVAVSQPKPYIAPKPKVTAAPVTIPQQLDITPTVAPPTSVVDTSVLNDSVAIPVTPVVAATTEVNSDSNALVPKPADVVTQPVLSVAETWLAEQITPETYEQVIKIWQSLSRSSMPTAVEANDLDTLASFFSGTPMAKAFQAVESYHTEHQSVDLLQLDHLRILLLQVPAVLHDFRDELEPYARKHAFDEQNYALLTRLFTLNPASQQASNLFHWDSDNSSVHRENYQKVAEGIAANKPYYSLTMYQVIFEPSKLESFPDQAQARRQAQQAAEVKERLQSVLSQVEAKDRQEQQQQRQLELQREAEQQRQLELQLQAERRERDQMFQEELLQIKKEHAARRQAVDEARQAALEQQKQQAAQRLERNQMSQEESRQIKQERAAKHQAAVEQQKQQAVQQQQKKTTTAVAKTFVKELLLGAQASIMQQARQWAVDALAKEVDYVTAVQHWQALSDAPEQVAEHLAALQTFFAGTPLAKDFQTILDYYTEYQCLDTVCCNNVKVLLIQWLSAMAQAVKGQQALEEQVLEALSQVLVAIQERRCVNLFPKDFYGPLLDTLRYDYEQKKPAHRSLNTYQTSFSHMSLAELVPPTESNPFKYTQLVEAVAPKNTEVTLAMIDDAFAVLEVLYSDASSTEKFKQFKAYLLSVNPTEDLKELGKEFGKDQGVSVAAAFKGALLAGPVDDTDPVLAAHFIEKLVKSKVFAEHQNLFEHLNLPETGREGYTCLLKLLDHGCFDVKVLDYLYDAKGMGWACVNNNDDGEQHIEASLTEIMDELIGSYPTARRGFLTQQWRELLGDLCVFEEWVEKVQVFYTGLVGNPAGLAEQFHTAHQKWQSEVQAAQAAGAKQAVQEFVTDIIDEVIDQVPVQAQLEQQARQLKEEFAAALEQQKIQYEDNLLDVLVNSTLESAVAELEQEHFVEKQQEQNNRELVNEVLNGVIDRVELEIKSVDQLAQQERKLRAEFGEKLVQQRLYNVDRYVPCLPSSCGMATSCGVAVYASQSMLVDNHSAYAELPVATSENAASLRVIRTDTATVNQLVEIWRGLVYAATQPQNTIFEIDDATVRALIAAHNLLNPVASTSHVLSQMRSATSHRLTLTQQQCANLVSHFGQLTRHVVLQVYPSKAVLNLADVESVKTFSAQRLFASHPVRSLIANIPSAMSEGSSEQVEQETDEADSVTNQPTVQDRWWRIKQAVHWSAAYCSSHAKGTIDSVAKSPAGRITNITAAQGESVVETRVSKAALIPTNSSKVHLAAKIELANFKDGDTADAASRVLAETAALAYLVAQEDKYKKRYSTLSGEQLTAAIARKIAQQTVEITPAATHASGVISDQDLNYAKHVVAILQSLGFKRAQVVEPKLVHTHQHTPSQHLVGVSSTANENIDPRALQAMPKIATDDDKLSQEVAQ